jgi:uncharacterized protein YbjT (DUF2867 family)
VDQQPEVSPAPAPAKGLAQSFDSAQATQRLAALTGTATQPSDAEARQTATQAVKSLPPPPTGWRPRDWMLVGGAALCGLAAALLFR